MAERGYSFSLTTFSPSGKLVQIEYALTAVAGGAPSVGIKAANGVVLTTEKTQKSILYEEWSVHKVEPITKRIGLVYSGMGPDFRVLVHRARKLAQQYYLVYQEPIPTAQLVQRVASVMQEYAQSGGVRPFGVLYLFVVGMRDNHIYFSQIHLELTLPGKPQQWERTMWMGKLSLRKNIIKIWNLKMPFIQPY